MNLGQGFPISTGRSSSLAAKRAIDEKPNQYAPMGGVPEFTKAIASRWERDAGQAIDPRRR